MGAKCGLVNHQNPCRCHKQIDYFTRQGFINPHQLQYAQLEQNTLLLIEKIEQTDKAAAVFRTNPLKLAPKDLLEGIRAAIGLF